MNRCAKNRLQISNRLWKKWKNVRSPRGDFFWLTLYPVMYISIQQNYSPINYRETTVNKRNVGRGLFFRKSL